MPPVRLGDERLSVTADVPVSVATFLRRVQGRIRSTVSEDDPLVIAQRLPELHIEPRDPVAAIAFLPDDKIGGNEEA